MTQPQFPHRFTHADSTHLVSSFLSCLNQKWFAIFKCWPLGKWKSGKSQRNSSWLGACMHEHIRAAWDYGADVKAGNTSPSLSALTDLPASLSSLTSQGTVLQATLALFIETIMLPTRKYRKDAEYWFTLFFLKIFRKIFRQQEFALCLWVTPTWCSGTTFGPVLGVTPSSAQMTMIGQGSVPWVDSLPWASVLFQWEVNSLCIPLVLTSMCM